MTPVSWLLVLALSWGVSGLEWDSDGLHPVVRKAARVASEESDNSFWNDKAQAALNNKVQRGLNQNIAKNVIMFLGDGMSIPTLAAARIYQEEAGVSREGEGKQLSFEQFPYSGLSMTYCVDTQVADSACSATAYLGGVKGNIGTIGVNGNVPNGDCEAMRNASNHVHSIAAWAQKAGKRTGIVTNARVTHASPAGTYAHVANRDWEADSDLGGQDTTLCDDIAEQLIYNEPGRNFNVIMGGGRPNFIPNSQNDPESGRGNRKDGVNLIDAWQQDKAQRGEEFAYVWNRDQLQGLTTNPPYVLGLFARSHLDYRLENNTKQPSVSEMTERAIRLLQQSETGYFLFVEGGRIDMAHHENKARISLDETVEFSDAIRKARSMTSESDTLIVVTADHAHTMSLSGYPQRSNSVLGIAGNGIDNKPYTTLSYANGPGYKIPVNNARPDIDPNDLNKFDYLYPTGLPLFSETHGGDDVGVFASGPWAHLFTGSFEQNYIPHAMGYASCLGDGMTACTRKH